MKLNDTQARQVVQDAIINKTVHIDYNYTVEYADRNKRWITGANISVDLLQFVPRENAEAFNQRCNLTETVTKPLIGSVMKPFKKVIKSNRIIKKIKPDASTGGTIEAVQAIQNKFDRFYGSDDYDSGLDYWLKTRFFELSKSDPNAFVMIEFEPDELDNGQLKPYPFEVSSEMAINFDIENNNLDWLLCRQTISYFADADKKAATNGYRFTIYCDKFSIVYHQTSTNQIAAQQNKIEGAEYITVGDGNKAAFWVMQYENLFGDVPGFRVGYMRDLNTNSRTYLVPFDDASPYIKKSIQTVSQLDITTATNVFPKEYAYVTNCPGTVSDAESLAGMTSYCNKGRTRNGEVCSLCKGTGAYVHKSGQDIVTIPLPDDKNEMYDLRSMRATFSPPVELLTYMTGIVDSYETKIHKAVFNTTVMIDKLVSAKTATEADYDFDSVYDTLNEFAEKLKSVWLTIAKFCAYITRTEDKVLFIYVNPSDWKLKTLTALYNERKAINESGAPSFSKLVVDDDIASIKLQDDTEALLAYEVKKKFFPFPGKTTDEVAAAMLQNYTPQSLKVLFQQFDYIFMQAELNNTNFYIQSYKNQKSIIDGIVNEMIEQLTPATPTFTAIKTDEEITTE